MAVALHGRRVIAAFFTVPGRKRQLAGNVKDGRLYALGIPGDGQHGIVKHLVRLAAAAGNGHPLLLPVLNRADAHPENIGECFIDLRCSRLAPFRRKETKMPGRAVFCLLISFLSGGRFHVFQ